MAFYYFRPESTHRRRIFILSHLNRLGSSYLVCSLREDLGTGFLQVNCIDSINIALGCFVLAVCGGTKLGR